MVSRSTRLFRILYPPPDSRREIESKTKESKMLKGFAAWTIAVTALIVYSPLSSGQTAQAKASSGAAAAPRHDISGTWTPARGEGDGIQGQGAKDMPEDGKPEHQLPYTPLALEKMKDYRPG